MAEIPKSIEIWICPSCGALGKDRGAVVTAPFGQQDMQSPCWRNAEHAEPVQAAYVLAEAADEMVEVLARALHSLPGPHEVGFERAPRRGFDGMHPNWQDKYRRYARALLIASSTQEAQGG